VEYHFEAQEPTTGYQLVASPANSPLRWQTFGLLRLPGQGESHEGTLGDEEAVITLLFGRGRVEIEERSGRYQAYDIGPRRDPFLDRATVVYLPPGTRYRVTSAAPNLQLAMHRAPAVEDSSAFLIEPHTLTSTSTGAHNWRRDVCVCVTPDMPVQRFIVGETINPPGNWSSYPPHKHDEPAPPHEAPYEEVYYFLFKPAQGFGFIRLYDPPHRENRMEEAFALQHGDTVVLPRGYHPVTVAPGYQLYYLFALVGESREYAAWSDDPDHGWVRACEPLFRE